MTDHERLINKAAQELEDEVAKNVTRYPGSGPAPAAIPAMKHQNIQTGEKAHQRAAEEEAATTQGTLSDMIARDLRDVDDRLEAMVRRIEFFRGRLR